MKGAIMKIKSVGEYQPDINVGVRIVEELNNKFDTHDLWHHSHDKELFELKYQSDRSDKEAWAIEFMGIPVISGGDFGLDYEDCQEENYVALTEKNERKIFMLAVANTVKQIEFLITLFANSDASPQNKQYWLQIMKDAAED